MKKLLAFISFFSINILPTCFGSIELKVFVSRATQLFPPQVFHINLSKEGFPKNITTLKASLQRELQKKDPHTLLTVNSLYIFEQKLRDDAAIEESTVNNLNDVHISINNPQIIGFHELLPKALLKLVEKPLFLLSRYINACETYYFAVTEQFFNNANINTIGKFRKLLNQKLNLSEEEKIKKLYLVCRALDDDFSFDPKNPDWKTLKPDASWEKADQEAYKQELFHIMVNIPLLGIKTKIPPEFHQLLGLPRESDLKQQPTGLTRVPNKQRIMPWALGATGIALVAYSAYRWFKTSKKTTLNKADFEKLVDQVVVFLQEENEAAIANLLTSYSKEDQQRIQAAAEARLSLLTSY